MKSLQRFVLSVAVLLVASMCNLAGAVPTLDGTADPNEGYAVLGPPQNTSSQFGVSEFDDLVASGGGSELNQVFGRIEDGRLYMVIAGNLENNFNKLMIFVDSVPGGVNQIQGDIFADPNDQNVPRGFDSFCCGGFEPPNGNNTFNIGGLQIMNNMQFDPNFSADYVMDFTHGRETVGSAAPIDPINFWAMSAHYADLTQGLDGDVVAAGIQIGPEGINRPMRLGAADFEQDFDTDGFDFLDWQRNAGKVGSDPNGVPNGSVLLQDEGNANLDDKIDGADLAIWEAKYNTDRVITDINFSPFGGGPSTADLLFGPQLPGLSQGDLIDKNYALGPNGGCTADQTDGNAGCAIPELEFLLPVDTNDAPSNSLNHRNFENTIGLQAAINNSNTDGVNGFPDPNVVQPDPNNPTDFSDTGDPENVFTGVEFSIPLSELGNPDPNSLIKITAFVNSGDFGFLSNQFAGTGILQGNLGLPNAVDLSAIAGDQFVTLSVPPVPSVAVVPEPTSGVLLVLGALGFFRRRWC